MSTQDQVACEDLKAFERRLIEIISSARPSTLRWRLVLLIASLCVAVGAVYRLGDPLTAEAPFFYSLLNHPFFSFSSLSILILFCCGIHRRVVAPSILVSRTREVLNDFAMDCDEAGRLILKPRQASPP
uniref:Transmembrane protein 188 n=1 Tax=Lepeophtheirus salmonis TaxID=72036 RepID=C1BS74_LEPSM|nr:Transmembrane protein 188 [Lepeophtheirus salmonis]